MPKSDAPRPIDADTAPELRKLMELAVRYPEIGPPVAALAYKVGHGDIGDRVSRMGREGDAPGVEYYFVAAQAARRERRFEDALKAAIEAIGALVEASPEVRTADEAQRLLHLVRLGFAVALFDIKDVQAARPLADALCAAAPTLEEILASDAFYRTLLAQALWYGDADESEAEWERAASLEDVETTWNARGTWYKDAENDSEKAEKTYRKGLEQAPESSLLLHNVAQVLVDRAEAHKSDAKRVRRLCNQADDLLRRALRGDAPKLRRHIHSTRDRLFELRRGLPQQGEGGKQRTGKKPNRTSKGNGRGRDGGKGSDRRQNQGNDFQRSGKMSLGDVLLAKLEEKQGSKS